MLSQTQGHDAVDLSKWFSDDKENKYSVSSKTIQFSITVEI